MMVYYTIILDQEKLDLHTHTHTHNPVSLVGAQVSYQFC